MNIPLSEQIDVLRLFFSGKLKHRDRIQNFRKTHGVKGRDYGEKSHACSLHHEVTHENMLHVVDRLKRTVVLVNGLRIAGYYLFVLECAVGHKRPGIGPEKIFPAPTVEQKQNAFNKFRKYLEAELEKPISKNQQG